MDVDVAVAVDVAVDVDVDVDVERVGSEEVEAAIGGGGSRGKGYNVDGGYGGALVEAMVERVTTMAMAGEKGNIEESAGARGGSCYGGGRGRRA